MASPRRQRSKTRQSVLPPGRVRDIPPAMFPAEQFDHVLGDMSATVDAAVGEFVAQVDGLDHPIERALAAQELWRILNHLQRQLVLIRMDAVQDAYARGRAEEGGGWYGYQAIGQQLGVAPSVVRHLLGGRNPSEDTTDQLADIRALSDARRAAVASIRTGLPPKEIAAATGLPVSEIARIIAAVKVYDEDAATAAARQQPVSATVIPLTPRATSRSLPTARR